MRHPTSNPPVPPAGFSCRGLGVDDAPAVAALIRADEIALLGAAYVDATDA